MRLEYSLDLQSSKRSHCDGIAQNDRPVDQMFLETIISSQKDANVDKSSFVNGIVFFGELLDCQIALFY